METGKIIDRTSYIIAAATFLFSLILFYTDNGMFLGSLGAALLAAGLAWMTFVILKLLWLALR